MKTAGLTVSRIEFRVGCGLLVNSSRPSEVILSVWEPTSGLEKPTFMPSHSPSTTFLSVEFRATIFHCPHWQTTALSKAFPSYIIPFYWVVPFMGVVRHHRLGHDHWVAISYRLGLIGTHDAFGLKTGSRFLLVTYGVTYILYICSAIWPFLWIIRIRYTRRAEVARSLYRSTFTQYCWGTTSTLGQTSKPNKILHNQPIPTLIKSQRDFACSKAYPI